VSERVRVFAADSIHLREIRTFITAAAVRDSFSGILSDILIGVSEACANAITYSGGAQIRLGWRAERDEVTITVEDDGVFRPVTGIPELDGRAHRGIHLMAAAMDRVEIEPGTPQAPGTRVTLSKRKTASAQRDRASGEGLSRR
jgi:anti-sigma regulatory factor (Ser/Thr protein kinase)